MEQTGQRVYTSQRKGAVWVSPGEGNHWMGECEIVCDSCMLWSMIIGSICLRTGKAQVFSTGHCLGVLNSGALSVSVSGSKSGPPQSSTQTEYSPWWVHKVEVGIVRSENCPWQMKWRIAYRVLGVQPLVFSRFWWSGLMGNGCQNTCFHSFKQKTVILLGGVQIPWEEKNASWWRFSFWIAMRSWQLLLWYLSPHWRALIGVM